MKGTLGIEDIGAPQNTMLRRWTRFERALGVGLDEPQPVFGACVRRVYRDGRGLLAQQDIHGRRDYSGANGKGTRGVRVWYTIEPDTLYWVNEPLSWRRSDQYYVAVTPCGNVYRLSQEEAAEWLSAL